TAANLRRAFDAADVLVSFNGKRFDVPFLEREFGLDVTTPHLDLLYPARRVGLTGGLKTIERAVGIDRDSDVDGREAVALWHRYEAGDEAALDRLVRYNRLDAENLLALLDAVTDRLDREVFEPHLPEDASAIR
ncbi:MAG: ribonuclease H-like domain-containing protein, partial [Halobacteriales archaeon]